MKKGVILIDIGRLKGHESADEARVIKLMGQIKSDQRLKRPIIVAKGSYVILDGHHRYEVLKRMNCRRIPAYLVDYAGGEVKVYLRRKDLIGEIIKEAVARRAQEGRPFPSKTTRHLIKNRPGLINFRIDKLKFD